MNQKPQFSSEVFVELEDKETHDTTYMPKCHYHPNAFPEYNMVEIHVNQLFARLSADGFLTCTEWEPIEDKEEFLLNYALDDKELTTWIEEYL